MKRPPKQSTSDLALRSLRECNFARIAKSVLGHLREYKKRHPGTTQKELDGMGEFLFNCVAIETKDVGMWEKVQQIRLKRQALVNDTRKLNLELRKHKEQSERVKKAVSDVAMTPEQREQRVKEILGIN